MKTTKVCGASLGGKTCQMALLNVFTQELFTKTENFKHPYKLIPVFNSLQHLTKFLPNLSDKFSSLSARTHLLLKTCLEACELTLSSSVFTTSWLPFYGVSFST